MAGERDSLGDEGAEIHLSNLIYDFFFRVISIQCCKMAGEGETVGEEVRKEQKRKQQAKKTLKTTQEAKRKVRTANKAGTAHSTGLLASEASGSQCPYVCLCVCL